MEAVMARCPRRPRREALSLRAKAASLLAPRRVVLKMAAGASRREAAREISCVPVPACRITARDRAEGEISTVDHRCDNESSKTGEDASGRMRQIPEKIDLEDRVELYVGTGVNV
jgi:hypothetical protein